MGRRAVDGSSVCERRVDSGALATYQIRLVLDARGMEEKILSAG
jgi:hypothetical protein